jgi:hypothetical protein
LREATLEFRGARAAFRIILGHRHQQADVTRRCLRTRERSE